MKIWDHLGLLFLGVILLQGIFVSVSYLRTRARGDSSETRRALFSLVLVAWGAAFFSPVSVGHMSGKVSSFFELFHPRAGNPYVVTSHVVWIVGAVTLAVWVFLLGGAEKLTEPPGPAKTDADKTRQRGAFSWGSPAHLKLFSVVTLAGGVAFELACWLDLPGPLPG